METNELHWRVLAALALLVAVAEGDICSAQEIREPITIGVPATREHGAPATFSYAIDLVAGSSYLLTVGQLNLDLVVTLEAPDGSRRTFNSPLARDGSEYVLIEPDEPGRYRISVASEELTNVVGGHRIIVDALADAATAPAWRLMTRAAEANAAGGEAQWQSAVADYDRAAELWAGLDAPALRAESLFAAGTIDYWQLYGWERAEERAARAAEIFAGLGDAKSAANATHLEGAAIVETALEEQQSDSSVEISPEAQALFAHALELLEQARRELERLGDRYDLGLVTNNLGYTHYNMGLLEEARRYYEDAATILAIAGETAAELKPRYNLAVIEVEQGLFRDGRETFERMLEILPEGRLDDYRSWSLDALGATELELGDAEEALRRLAEAHAIQVQIDDRQGQARSLRRIGQTYYSLGELELAAQYLQQALPMAEETSDGRNREAALRALGDVAYAESRYELALDYHRRALETAASVFDRAHLELLVARDLRGLGRLAEASDLATRAAGAPGASAVLAADAALELGWIELADGEVERADREFARARDAFGELGLLSERADAKHGLSLSAKRAGRLEEAAAHGEAALADLERMRLRVVNPELRAQLGATRRRFYEAQVDLYMTLYERRDADAERYLRAALATSERARARTITDLIVGPGATAPDADRSAGDELAGGRFRSPEPATVDSSAHVAALRARQAELIETLAQKTRQRDVLIDRQIAAADPVYRTLNEQLAALETELDLLEVELRSVAPALAGGRAAEPLDVVGIQAALDPNTIALQYFIGDARSLVFVVGRQRVDVVALADRATIEAATRSALERLASYSGEARPLAALDALSDLVLGPVESHLRRASRVVVAADGALQYVPFAVLPQGDGGDGLLETHDIVEVPSMSTVVALRSRARDAAAAKTLAVFADPVLTPDDPRLGVVALAEATGPDDYFARSSLTTRLDRLQSSGYEAERIASLVPENDRLVASGFAASRENIVGADLRDYRYIHFATHGLVDSRYPGLSALALSSFDARGRARPGLLRLHDIANLELDADLVVLSACETALGREIRGEGFLGLTQAFMSAGARSVIASLWQVPDRATAELMARFYEHLIDGAMEPVSALRSAQLEIAATRRWRDPYFWGGFVLIGDWR